MGRYRTSESSTDRMKYESLRGIWEFQANINTLIKLKMLNRELILELLRMSITPWIAFNNRVDLRKDANDHDQKSTEETLWFRDRVRSFGEVLGIG